MNARVIVGRGEGSDVLVMFPSGDICRAKSVKTAERMVLAWAKRNLPASGILITSIVWRDGLEPTIAQ
jgi:hypothetical protein